MLKGKTKTAACLTASAVASLLTVASSAQQVVYQNQFTGTPDRTTAANGVPVGDVVGLTSPGVLSSASFGYYLSPTRSGNETATLNLYALDPSGLPGVLLFSSSAFDISTGTTGEGYGTLNIGNINQFVPDSIGYTITFSGLDTGETAGLLFANDPALIGSNPTFFDSTTSSQEHFTIRNDGGNFVRLDFPGVIDNLNAQFTVVPEPSTFALMIGGLAAMRLLRRRK